jgi:hypothetical protein
MPNKLKILRVKDKLDSLKIKKYPTPDLCHSALFIAKSGVGKSNLIANLLLRKEPEFYNDNFDGDNIFLISPSIDTDDKLRLICEVKEIPESNIFDFYDTSVLTDIFKIIKNEYKTAINDDDKVPNFLIIIDDCADSLKQGGRNNPLEKLYIAGRHSNITIWTTSQYYSSVPPVVRTNSNVIYVWDTPHKEIIKIAEEHSNVKNDIFVEKFRNSVNNEKHHFIVIDYTKPNNERYRNHEFEALSFS